MYGTDKPQGPEELHFSGSPDSTIFTEVGLIL